MVRFILIGWFFADIDELINFPFNPLDADVTLFQEILFTTPIYVMAYLFWFRVLRTYRFSHREAIFTGGLSLGFVEMCSAGINPMILFGIFIVPFIIMIHGFHMFMPKLALSDELEASAQKDTRWNYAAGIFLPIIGAIIGIIIAFLLALLLQILGML
ncbi:MAG: hypothetical protein M8349_05675 [ANME-2 cluster archaeon]|nr:hypothetical protein [ANME-2 cluster archaeon]